MLVRGALGRLGRRDRTDLDREGAGRVRQRAVLCMDIGRSEAETFCFAQARPRLWIVPPR